MQRPREARRLRGAALDLAAARIVTALLILAAADVWAAPARIAALASWSEADWRAPPGAGWLLWIGPHPSLAQIALGLVLGGAAIGWIGPPAIRLGPRVLSPARLGFGICALGLLYLLGAAQLDGAPAHPHHLLWFATLMAASPCDRSLSLRALADRRRGEAPPPDALAFGAPLRIGWALIGLIYLAPGLWKLASPEWRSGEALGRYLHWKWIQTPGLEPIAWLTPGWIRAGAWGAAALEVLALPGLMTRRTRWVTSAALLSFHQATGALMGIHFSSLWALYAIFVPWAELWGGIRARLGDGAPDPARPDLAPPSARGGLGIGAALLVGAALAGGLGQVRGWPFACYPTFHEAPGAWMPALEIVAVGPGESERSLPRALLAPRQRDWGEIWRLAGIGGPSSAAALEALWARRAAAPEVAAWASGASGLQIYRARIAVDPAEGGRIERGPLLHEIPLE